MISFCSFAAATKLGSGFVWPQSNHGFGFNWFPIIFKPSPWIGALAVTRPLTAPFLLCF